MEKVLWVSPNFNHYKARFLNHFAQRSDINLSVLAGAGVKGVGHDEIKAEWDFDLVRVDVPKRKFGFSLQVAFKIISVYKEFDWVMIPREKKNVFLILLIHLYRRLSFANKTKLFSYNHPFFGNKLQHGWSGVLLKFFYRIYDLTIFYTEKSAQLAIEAKVIKPNKAGWANNTLDDLEIARHYEYSLPDLASPKILFIGRLISSKRADLALDYYKALKKNIPNLQLVLIGTGPELDSVKEKSQGMDGIDFAGAQNDEAVLARYFKSCSLVFVPGHSGLSINHAFLYGRTYITLNQESHAPEIHYLNDGENGLVLNGNFEENVTVMHDLLTSPEKLHSMSAQAYETGKSLSMANWCKQVVSSFEKVKQH